MKKHTLDRYVNVSRIKRGLNKALMMVLALMFVVSIFSVVAPVEAEAATRRFGFHWRVGTDANQSITEGATINPFGELHNNLGHLRVGYRVGAAATQVRPITVTVTNNTTTTQTGVTVGLSGVRPADFQVGALSRTTIPAGETATFTIQPIAGLTLPANTSHRDSNLLVTVGVPGLPDQQGTFRVQFRLLPALAPTANRVVPLRFGEPMVHNRWLTDEQAVNVNLTRPRGLDGQQLDGRWRWISPATETINVNTAVAEAQLPTRVVEFVPTDNNSITRIPMRQTVRVRVNPLPVAGIDGPTFYPLALGQSLGDARMRADSPHTRGGTWHWIDAAGRDFSAHRPQSATGFTFTMQFRPLSSANFTGIGTTPVTRSVDITVHSPTLRFVANDLVINVGAATPTLADLTYRITGLISGDQPGSTPTLRLNLPANFSTAQPGVFQNAILIEGGSLPLGSAANNYRGVEHVAGTIRVVAVGAGGDAGGTGPTTTLAPGWHQVDGNWVYAEAGGRLATGWVNAGGGWFYMDSAGVMQTGWLDDGGTWYFLRPNGAMAVGWVLDEGNWFLLGSSGDMQTGWRQVGGTWYFLESGGRMATGWVQVGGTWYYMRADGSMVTGVQTIGGVRHRFNASGVWLGRA
ncbi:MAG: hypothetical protein FWC13_09260 [Oscillospiraceae bacterium]|nr:hypothetical protein [Oscillospiraceae bacterium]